MTQSSIVEKSIFRMFVLRVSGKGDHQGSANQLEVLRGCEHVPGVPWLLHNFDIRIMQASSAAGRRLRESWRRQHGLIALHRKGRDDLLGISVVVEGTRFLLYASTAAQLDEESGNAFTRHLISFIKEPAFTGHADPDFTRRRDSGELDHDDHPTLCNAFDVTRFVRSQARASELWEAATWARAAFDVKDVRVDPEGGEAQQMIWTFLAFGSEMESVVGKLRRFVGRLNLLRAGCFPLRRSAAPLGWTTDPHAKQRPLLVDRSQVSAVAALHRLGMATDDFTAIANELGTAFAVTSSDQKALGTPIHQLEVPAAAARRLFLRRKLEAYRDGELEVRSIGVLANKLRPGSGHVLQRRWHGVDAAGRHDEFGAISYRIAAPRPDVLGPDGGPRPGWLPGLTAEQEHVAWTRLIARHGWIDDRTEPDTDLDTGAGCGAEGQQLLGTAAARSGAAGRRDQPTMALARLCLFRDADAGETGARTKLFPRAPQAGSQDGRYELRRETGVPRKAGVDYTKTALIASWPDHELRGHVAGLLRQVTHRLLDQGHQLGQLTVTAPTFVGSEDSDPASARRQQVSDLRNDAQGARDLARGLDREAGAEQLHDEPDEERLQELRAESRRSRTSARDLDRKADDLDTQPQPKPTFPSADFGQLRDIIAALEGVYARGTVPAPLNRALRDLLPGGLRFSPGPDTVTITLVATIEVPLAGGGTATVTDEIVIPHAAGRGTTELGHQRIHDLAKRWMTANETIEAVAAAGRITTPDHTLRLIREVLTSGSRRTDGQLDTDEQQLRMPDPQRRVTAFSCPIPELRSVVWHRLTKTRGRPATATAAWADLINSVYFSEPPASRAGGSDNGRGKAWAWESNVDLRLDQHTVLLSLPGPAKQMRADHLGAALAVPGRRGGYRMVLDASCDLPRNGHTYPATLRRVPTVQFPEGWHGKATGFLSAGDKFVELAACLHVDCPETHATAVVFAPEVLAFGTALLCRRCKRPAIDTPEARRTVFPDSVISWADDQPRLTGAWVQCARSGCVADVGAGPGLTWQWAGSPGPTWHDDSCRTGTTPPATFVQCPFADCQIDEGGGPGCVAIGGQQSSRRWHSRACESAERRRLRADDRARRFGSCAWTQCTLDEGNGPGSIAGAHHAQRTHANPQCRAGARDEDRQSG